MSSYSEQTLIERPAIALLESMGWAHLMVAARGPQPPSPLTPLPGGEEALTRDRSAMTPVAANRELEFWLSAIYRQSPGRLSAKERGRHEYP